MRPGRGKQRSGPAPVSFLALPAAFTGAGSSQPPRRQQGLTGTVPVAAIVWFTTASAEPGTEAGTGGAQCIGGE